MKYWCALICAGVPFWNCSIPMVNWNCGNQGIPHLPEARETLFSPLGGVHRGNEPNLQISESVQVWKPQIWNRGLGSVDMPTVNRVEYIIKM